MLRDDDAEAVEAVTEIADHDFGQAHAEILETLLRQVGAYEFDEALITLSQLRELGIADGG